MFLMNMIVLYIYLGKTKSKDHYQKLILSIYISIALWRNIMFIFRSSKKILLDLTQEIFFSQAMQRTTLNENDHNHKNLESAGSQKNVSSTNGPPQNKNGLMLKDKKIKKQY